MSWPHRAERDSHAERDYHAPRLWTTTDDGHALWVYSCRAYGRLWALGYCSPRCSHATPEAAEAHYREYLLDTARFDGHWQGVAYRCELCDAWTDRFAQLASFALHRLCPRHLTREGLGQVLGSQALGSA